MKKTIISGALAVLFIGSVAAQNNSTEILPQQAIDFISTHFSSEKATRVEEEDEWFSFDSNEMYEVHFANGVRVDFNKKGEPTEVTARNGASIPAEVFPEAIRIYIDQNYSGSEIVAWELDKNKQEVELADGREIEFDLNNRFKKED